MLVVRPLALSAVCFALVAAAPAQEPVPQPQADETEPELASALDAAEFTLETLQQWSAPGLRGASWLEPKTRSAEAERALAERLGGAPPTVTIGKLRADLVEMRRDEPAHYEVQFDLLIRSDSGMVVAARMLEEFLASMDESNGQLAVGHNQTRLDSDSNAIHALSIQIELPLEKPLSPPAGLKHPLTAVIQRVADSGVKASSLKITPVNYAGRGKNETAFQIQQSGAEHHLSAASCGVLLRCLGTGDGALPIRGLSLSRVKDSEIEEDQWNVSATVFIGGI